MKPPAFLRRRSAAAEVSGERPLTVLWRRAIRDERQLSATAKLVAFNLAEYMNRAGWCNPGVGRQAGDTGRDPRTVRRALAELEAAGFLTRNLGGGRGKTSGYQAVLPVARIENPGDMPPFKTRTETRAAVHENPGGYAQNPGDTPPEEVKEEVLEEVKNRRSSENESKRRRSSESESPLTARRRISQIDKGENGKGECGDCHRQVEHRHRYGKVDLCRECLTRRHTVAMKMGTAIASAEVAPLAAEVQNALANLGQTEAA